MGSRVAGVEMPGDELLPKPGMLATRAITIEAPASAIWPWLVQRGSGRGGAYTYDWIENLLGLGMHSATEILPPFQDLKVGDALPVGPKGPRLKVEVLDPEVPSSARGGEFLVGDRAYKMRKPVDPGFLDFRTDPARRQACHRELALDRWLAAGSRDAALRCQAPPRVAAARMRRRGTFPTQTRRSPRPCSPTPIPGRKRRSSTPPAPRRTERSS